MPFVQGDMGVRFFQVTDILKRRTGRRLYLFDCKYIVLFNVDLKISGLTGLCCYLQPFLPTDRRCCGQFMVRHFVQENKYNNEHGYTENSGGPIGGHILL